MTIHSRVSLIDYADREALYNRLEIQHNGSPENTRVTANALNQLIDLLTLEKIDENLYRGQSEATDWGRIYGGQVIAQSLSAAKQQVAAERNVHSFHSYFLRPGDPSLPIIFEVESNLDAGTISNRRVKAVQKGRPIFFMTCSFQVNMVGLDHGAAMPAAPEPDNLPRETDLLENNIQRAPEDWLPKFNAVRAIDFRTVDSTAKGAAAGRQLWMKPTGALPADPLIHQYVMAYASDFFFLA
ncbi:MAG: acyl-CoA thioesterase-2, partial [Bacteroidia bacterium]